MVGSPLFQPYKSMTKTPSWLANAARYVETITRICEKLQVDNANNLEKKVYKLIEELEKERTRNGEYLQLTQTNDHGEAKQRVRALMNKAGTAKIALTEKYNLDASFLEGIGDMWDKQGEGRDQLKVFASMEKKLEHQRRMVSEAYTYMLDLVEQKTAEANYAREQTLEVITVWHEEMKERFHELTALEFWQEYKGNMLNLDLNLNKTEKTASLYEAKVYCEEYYPALLLTQTFTDPQTLGTVPLYTLEKWGEIYAKATQIADPKAKRKELFTLARTVMKKAIFRKAEGTEAVPSIEQDNLLEQLLTLDEYSPYGKTTGLSETTQLNDILSEFIFLTCQV